MWLTTPLAIKNPPVTDGGRGQLAGTNQIELIPRVMLNSMFILLPHKGFSPVHFPRTQYLISLSGGSNSRPNQHW